MYLYSDMIKVPYPGRVARVKPNHLPKSSSFEKYLPNLESGQSVIGAIRLTPSGKGYAELGSLGAIKCKSH
ncbi:hypothetical protein D3C80_1507500 [compost metagenome]